MIQLTQIDGQSIYYLSDKNKNALQAIIALKKSRILCYRELKSITKVFGVDLSKDEKHRCVKPIRNRVIPVFRKENGVFCSSLKKNQVRLDDFMARDDLPGRNQSKGFKKSINEKKVILLRK
jgi:hypothetical protein